MAFLDPDNIPVGKVKGLALYLKRQYNPSSKAFEHVLEVGDDSYGSHYYLGHDYRETAQFFEANEHFLKAWQIDSSDVALAVSIARLHSIPIFAQDADLWFNKALAMLEPDPEDLSMVYQSYGEAEYSHQNWDKALPLYKEAYKVNPKNLSLISTIGYIYEQKKDYKSAIEWYERYLSLGKDSSGVFVYMEAHVHDLHLSVQREGEQEVVVGPVHLEELERNVLKFRAPLLVGHPVLPPKSRRPRRPNGPRKTRSSRKSRPRRNRSGWRRSARRNSAP